MTRPSWRSLTSAEGYPMIDFCCVEPVPMLLSTAEMRMN
jgi:hypothetical protein